MAQRMEITGAALFAKKAGGRRQRKLALSPGVN
jgi:hypothetical protein